MHQDKPTIEEIIIVEGRDDTAAIRQAVDAVTIETHGFGIRPEVWDTIETAYRTKGIIVFTDPDTAGEQIRRRVLERFPDAKEAFLDQRLATKDGDIGIENASPESIREALAKVHGAADRERGTDRGHGDNGVAGLESGERRLVNQESANHGAAGRKREKHGSVGGFERTGNTFVPADMFRWRLDGVPGASKRRREVGMRLGIGQATAKTFLQRLNRFGISREEVEEALTDLTEQGGE